MSTDEITKQLPDVWFDWYARLIPGCIGVSSYFWFFDMSIERKTEDILLLIFFAYIIGHIAQPFSSAVVNWMFKNRLRPRINKIVSKSYAETISMFSCGVLLTILIVYSFFDCRQIDPRKYCISVLLIIVFFIGTWLRGVATKKKVKELS